MIMKTIKKALPRRERVYPQAERAFSTNFVDNLFKFAETDGNKCFVPLEDFRVLQKRYVKLFKKYQRARQSVDLK